ncbi:hypothetical protein ACFYRN_40025 [Streptomyces sp. NPDC005227]|uniref:hypothetical protein n=1 Tax=unclassified Streptomyces TaxID=2593676 RepID=UPI0036BA189C
MTNTAAATALLNAAFPAEVRRQPLGWKALQSWEDRHGVVLPEPYRTFVAEIANGVDVGPSEEDGLLTLGETPAGWVGWKPRDWFSPEPFDGTAARSPALPFPLKDDTQWAYDYDPRQSPLQHQAYQWGSVLLGRDDPGPDCTAAFWALVVAGPQRGQIWTLSDAGAAPYVTNRHYVWVPGGEPVLSPPGGFVEWVQDWHTGRGWWRAD